MKPKLLWHSNAPYSPTGYGNQTGLFAPRLLESYDVVVSSFYGLEGARLVWEGVPIYPGLGGDFGNDYIVEHAKRHFGGPRDGLVVTLMDVWVLDPQQFAQMDVASWCPVDHEPAPPAVLEYFAASGAVPIAMSRFGEAQLAGLDPLYVPHAVDAQTFSPRDRMEVREQTGVSGDAFLIGMVAANKGRPSRKGFEHALQAFRVFREKHDDAVLYLHTTLNPNHAQGEDLPALINALGIPPKAVVVADQYRMAFDPYPADTMAKVYSCMDVLLNPAHGEGFGIPILEAQACGVPAIVTNFSAMPEVCGAGWHVACRPHWTGQRSFQAIPEVEDVVAALEHCHRMSRAEKRSIAARARKHALAYDADAVLAAHMLPALAAASERFQERRPVRIAA